MLRLEVRVLLDPPLLVTTIDVRIAQMDRASVSGTEGPRFKSWCEHHFRSRGRTAEPPACHAGDSRVSTGRFRHFCTFNGKIAQLVERATLNRKVGGSMPPLPTTVIEAEESKHWLVAPVQAGSSPVDHPTSRSCPCCENPPPRGCSSKVVAEGFYPSGLGSIPSAPTTLSGNSSAW